MENFLKKKNQWSLYVWNNLNVSPHYLKKLVWSFLLILSCSVSLCAQQSETGNKTDKTIIDGFMDKRFGMFIHFGPVTLRGTEIGWSRGKEVPTEEYDNLYK